MTNGTPYTFTVTANNSVGASPPSLPTAAVTQRTGLGATPNAPTSFDGHADGSTVSLNWNPPASAVGTPITGYTISAAGLSPVSVTGHSEIWATSDRNIFTTIGGLTPLQPYTFQISADNVAGAGKPAATTLVPGTSAPCSGAKLAISPQSAAGEPGQGVPVTTRLTDGCGTPLTGAKVYLSATNGYQVGPGSPADVGDLAPGASASQDWTVAVPADATGSAALLAVAVFGNAGQDESAQAAGSVTIPAPSLRAGFDNVGVTDDGNTTIGNLDGAGSSFSAQALAAAGATPGATVTYNGVPFTWPDVASGQNDNAVASGQSFDISGSGSTLSFLLTAGYGPATGTGQVVYTDGSTDQFTLTSPDWHGGCKSATDPGTVAVHALPQPGQRAEHARGLRVLRVRAATDRQDGRAHRAARRQRRRRFRQPVDARLRGRDPLTGCSLCGSSAIRRGSRPGGKRVDGCRDLLAQCLVVHESVRSDGVTRDRYLDACRIDDARAGVAQDGAQRRVRAAGSGRGGRHVDPPDRLVVDLAAADRPVQQVLQRARQCAGVLRRREQDRVRTGYLRPKVRNRGMQRRGVIVGIEVR